MKAILTIKKNSNYPFYDVNISGKKADPDYFNGEFNLSGNDLGNILYTIGQGLDKVLIEQDALDRQKEQAELDFEKEAIKAVKKEL